jgi:hypothetical protein
LKSLNSTHPDPANKATDFSNSSNKKDDSVSNSVSNSTPQANKSIAPSGAFTWDVTSQASSRSTGTNKSITVRHLIKSLKKAMLHETPAVCGAINEDMSQLVVPTKTAPNIEKDQNSGSANDDDKANNEDATVKEKGDDTEEVPPPSNPPTVPRESANDNTVMSPPPPPSILCQHNKSSIVLATPSMTSTAKDGTCEDE